MAFLLSSPVTLRQPEKNRLVEETRDYKWPPRGRGWRTGELSTGHEPSFFGLGDVAEWLERWPANRGRLGSKPRGGWKIKYFKQVNFTWRVITARRDPIEVVPAFKKGRYRPEKNRLVEETQDRQEGVVGGLAS